jgi:hypothetical protein
LKTQKEPAHLGHLIFEKGAKIIYWEKKKKQFQQMVMIQLVVNM